VQESHFRTPGKNSEGFGGCSFFKGENQTTWADRREGARKAWGIWEQKRCKSGSGEALSFCAREKTIRLERNNVQSDVLLLFKFRGEHPGRSERQSVKELYVPDGIEKDIETGG